MEHYRHSQILKVPLWPKEVLSYVYIMDPLKTNPVTSYSNLIISPLFDRRQLQEKWLSQKCGQEIFNHIFNSYIDKTKPQLNLTQLKSTL